MSFYHMDEFPEAVQVTEYDWPQDALPVVSVACLTYNHEPFIRECIEGFLIQKTSFPIEILIHDDASTDGTATVVAEYAARYPQLIKPIFQIENQYSKGVNVNRKYNTLRAKGEFIALCEGDDYWTDPYKLEQQVRFLRAHPDYGLVADNTMVLDTTSGTNYLFNNESEFDPSIERLLGIRVFGTAAAMYRKSLVLDHGEEPLSVSGDIGLWCYLATKGKVRYFDRVTSVYRRGYHGVNLGSDQYNWAVVQEEWNKKLRLFLGDRVDKELFAHRNYHAYHHAFFSSLAKRDYYVLLLSSLKCLWFKPMQAIIDFSGVVSLVTKSRITRILKGSRHE